ncbi:hypothetical protein OS493_002161 [Desmophyllum pertusum]|uniref:Uncharacterized protein n=1 Tax=Desmophyllum pertusum TaxID=174260 RepID=A0A9W9Z8E2_9CNID|nr:hypothetical protein OS493_002161 [Desmophyllum pertusum]
MEPPAALPGKPALPVPGTTASMVSPGLTKKPALPVPGTTGSTELPAVLPGKPAPPISTGSMGHPGAPTVPGPQAPPVPPATAPQPQGSVPQTVASHCIPGTVQTPRGVVLATGVKVVVKTC